MNQQPYLTEQNEPAVSSAALAKSFMNRVYMWMAASMLLTAGTAAYAVQDIEIVHWVLEHWLMLCLGTLGIVFGMSFGASRLSFGALALLLLLFSFMEGLIFGPILLSYSQDTVCKAFGCTALMFGGMSIFGALTKRDLSTMGRTLITLFIGLLGALIINIFWGNSMLDLGISCAGVVIFALFTAYDTQNLLKIGLCDDPIVQSKGAVLGALTLYLDFINLFLMLLRLFGRDE